MNKDIIPLDEAFILINAGQRCDALIGPCACGATHRAEDIQSRFKKLCGAQQSALETYIAKLDATQQERDAACQQRDEARAALAGKDHEIRGYWNQFLFMWQAIFPDREKPELGIVEIAHEVESLVASLRTALTAAQQAAREDRE